MSLNQVITKYILMNFMGTRYTICSQETWMHCDIFTESSHLKLASEKPDNDVVGPNTNTHIYTRDQFNRLIHIKIHTFWWLKPHCYGFISNIKNKIEY